MTGRHLTTALTMTVLTGIVVVMAVWGFNAATAPYGDRGDPVSSGPTCAPEQQKVTENIRRKDVTVSVYNSGKRSGRAQATLDQLEEAGFKAGAVGNAPEDLATKRAVVYAADRDDPAAKLVALAFGPKTEVQASADELGPGIAVVIGDKFERLDAHAPRKMELAEPEVDCLPAD